jgi:DNA primase
MDRLVEDARARPILAVARALGMEPRRAGREYVVSCPFHDDKTPSLFLTPGNDLWHCFSCGRGGDALSLAMQVKRIGFMDAVKELAA